LVLEQKLDLFAGNRLWKNYGQRAKARRPPPDCLAARCLFHFIEKTRPESLTPAGFFVPPSLLVFPGGLD